MNTFWYKKFTIPGIIVLSCCWWACSPNKRLQSAYSNPLSITTLNLSTRGLDSIPDQVYEMVNLRKLVLFRNRFTLVPSDIGKLEKLEELSFQSNRLDSVAPELGHLKRLRKLNLRFNKLTSLPEETGDLKSLVELDLRNNELENLPEEIGDLSKLEYLYLSDNKLNELPSSISRLYNLRLLHVGRNNIQGALPEFIGNLESLIELDVTRCCSDINLPQSLANLNKLELLIISPYQVLPYGVGSKNPRLRVVVR